MKLPAVYILASERNGTLYTGVTSDLVTRTAEHRSHSIPGFTQRYRVDLLVWFEAHPSMVSAIQREKAIKQWRRKWKLALIEKANPCWKDLYESITERSSRLKTELSRTPAFAGVTAGAHLPALDSLPFVKWDL